MIWIREAGDYFRVGLNLCFARDHIAVHWAWYDFAKREGSHRGFTVSRKGFRRRSARWNVVDEYAAAWGLELVNREVLQDLKEAERAEMKRNERIAYLRHRLDTSRTL
jgi:hypothetical protein